MKILSWNYRWTSKPHFVNYTKSLVRQYSLDICCFLKTKLLEGALPHIHRIMGSHWKVYMTLTVRLSGAIVVALRKDIGIVDFIHYDA